VQSFSGATWWGSNGWVSFVIGEKRHKQVVAGSILFFGFRIVGSCGGRTKEEII